MRCRIIEYGGNFYPQYKEEGGWFWRAIPRDFETGRKIKKGPITFKIRRSRDWGDGTTYELYALDSATRIVNDFKRDRANRLAIKNKGVTIHEV